MERHDAPTFAGTRASTDHPARIGPYRILQVLGEGGMGIVYVADQSAPIARRVALKALKLGMDTKQFVARFEAERQALAVMDHPGIARVYDAGATESGRPYFVMELVHGVPITDPWPEISPNSMTRGAGPRKPPNGGSAQRGNEPGRLRRSASPNLSAC